MEKSLTMRSGLEEEVLDSWRWTNSSVAVIYG
jgi:hypothetical protein